MASKRMDAAFTVTVNVHNECLLSSRYSGTEEVKHETFTNIRAAMQEIVTVTDELCMDHYTVTVHDYRRDDS